MPLSSKHTVPSKSGFKNIFTNPDLKINKDGFFVLAKKNNKQNPRLGVSIKKRDYKLATERNRIKRKIKGSFMSNISLIPALDIIVMVRPGKGTENKKYLTGLWHEVEKKSNA